MRDVSLIESKFANAGDFLVCRLTDLIERLQECFIELESCLFATKERRRGFVSSILTHVFPIILFDIGKIRKKEESMGFLSEVLP